jgi:hypothetical protein
MFKGATLFALIFILIAPKSREFLITSIGQANENLSKWAPFSYIVVALLIAAPIVSFFVIKTWPEHKEPENPMTKYRREVPEED